MPREKPAPDSPQALTGAAIRELREERRLSRADLATACGAASAKVVESWETGWRTPPLWSIDSLADGLGVTASALAERIAAKLSAKKI